jgi:hypothetical protein
MKSLPKIYANSLKNLAKGGHFHPKAIPEGKNLAPAAILAPPCQRILSVRLCAREPFCSRQGGVGSQLKIVLM